MRPVRAIRSRMHWCVLAGMGRTGEAIWHIDPSTSIRGTLNVKLGGKNMTFYQRVTALPRGAVPMTNRSGRGRRGSADVIDEASDREVAARVLRPGACRSADRADFQRAHSGLGAAPGADRRFLVGRDVAEPGVIQGQPMRLHLPLPIDATHFERWLGCLSAPRASCAPRRLRSNSCSARAP